MATGSTRCIRDDVAQKFTNLAVRVRHAAEIDPEKEPLDAGLESATPDWSSSAPKALHGRSVATVNHFVSDRKQLKSYAEHLFIFVSFS